MSSRLTKPESRQGLIIVDIRWTQGSNLEKKIIFRYEHIRKEMSEKEFVICLMLAVEGFIHYIISSYKIVSRTDLIN